PTSDLVRVYLTDIGKVALLNAEQEVDLAKRIEAGLFAAEKMRAADAKETRKIPAKLRRDLEWIAADGVRARNHLLEANLRLVVSLAKRYQGKGLTLLDLIQEGNIGLVRAVEKFDELGKALDMTGERVEEILGYGRETLSLETPVGDDGTATFGEFIEDGDAPVAADVVDFGLLQDRLRSVLGTLPDRSAAVMRMRFGLDDGRARTLDEVGKELNLTRERIRQIERDTLKDLRRSQTAATLKAWL